MMRRYRAFMLNELLVVVAVACILTAVAIPAIQNARESARRNQCTDRLRQMGMALNRYHDTHKVFPVGQVSNLQKLDPIGRYLDAQEAKLGPGEKSVRPPSGASWIVSVLPMLGEEAIYQNWQLSKNVRTNGDGSGPAQIDIPKFYCPSRRSSMGAGGSYSVTERVDPSWQSGGNDYAGCSGSGVTFKDDDEAARQTYWLNTAQLEATALANGTGSPFSQAAHHAGVFGVNTAVGMSAMTDGTSTTILVSERRVFSNAAAVSAVPPANASTPNQRRSSDGWAFGGPATMFSTRLAPQPPGPKYGRHFDEAGSEHPLGFNIVCGDGSVRFINLGIDLRTWNNLGNIAQGSPVNNLF
ncbi:DUF1559 family PulG-like putative transporter [Planctomicrobium sp. SH527]|uniref:DUF1559 family PulG-like putative transporter n=1 Tax=Planctomicrobium sp. SH527 TaxID=3448123 RepID=UPI003F5C7B39